MKKTLIIITAITLLFTACNADATSGLFRTATQARESINIQYTQIIGREAANTNLYFLTKEGLFVKESNAKSSSLILRSVEGNRIQRAAYLSATKILIKTDMDNGSLFEFNPLTKIKTLIPIPSTLITDFRLMPNGKIVLIGAKDSGEFWIADSGDIDNYSSTGKQITAGQNYGLAGLFTPSNYEDSTESKEFLLSFVGSDEYKNFYFDGTNLHDLTGLTEAIANFALVDNKIFVLTVNGKLYYYASSPYTTPILLADSSSEFGQYGIFYPIEIGGEIHFITSPDVSDSMTVFTVDKSNPQISTTITTNGIKFGYAATLKDTHIVSSLKLDDTNFLVATEKHGMYSVRVNPSAVPDGGGTVSPAEGYTF